MKQHITVNQLNGLSQKGLNKLKDWIQKKESKLIIKKFGSFPPAIVPTTTSNELIADFMTIGQMMEFLLDNKIDLRDVYNCDRKFCNQLWDDVKKVLEDKYW